MLGETEPTSLVNMFRILPNFDLDDVRGLPAFQYRDDPAVPLIPVTHRPYNRSLFLGRPVIFLVRDPRDVTVSSYFHATRHKHRFNGDIAAFMKDEEQGLPDLLRYLDGWAGALNEGRDLVVSYEELSAEPADVTRRILEFLKVPIDRAKVEKAVHASRFEAMRELEVKEGIPAHDYDRSDAESMRMRKGKAGGFTDYLDAGGVAALQKAIAERLSPAGKALLLRTGYKEV
jgi:alcohol sulfotransferase